MAAPLTGVHRSQPAFTTRPVLAWSAACPAAALRATALARVPPNHAARPTSCSERETVLVDMGSPRVGFTVGGRAIPLGAVGNRPRPARSTGPGSRAQGATSSELAARAQLRLDLRGLDDQQGDVVGGVLVLEIQHRGQHALGQSVGGQAGRILEHPEEPVLPEELPAAAGLGHPVGVEQQRVAWPEAHGGLVQAGVGDQAHRGAGTADRAHRTGVGADQHRVRVAAQHEPDRHLLRGRRKDRAPPSGRSPQRRWRAGTR